ncbi:uncharacterized protein LOC113301221 isoform X2 [Papaver somniferum]|uniref:uncharacterized protein LOC113301221 isoform X2 n=1 Tax=Papaver somniferum TaxID=3469 RepID=UPI000E70468C|nr:uncharacterized protein LOC113301221 isoform X2 [Papaver somniferum]
MKKIRRRSSTTLNEDSSTKNESKDGGKSPKGMVNVPTIIVKVKHSTIGEKVVAAALIPTHGMAAPNSNNASADGNIMEEGHDKVASRNRTKACP